jgi:hypothetical protein
VEYLLKKINMIDILGMCIPGGLLLLLLEQDIHCFEGLKTYFGLEPDNFIWIVIFLCGSYGVGMLLHELGSMAEKLLWKNPLFNPRVYAAVSTFLVFEYENFPPKLPKNAIDENKYLGYLEQNAKKNEKIIKAKNVISGLARSVSILPAFALVFFASGVQHWWMFTIVLIVFFLACILIHWGIFDKSLYFYISKKNEDKQNENEESKQDSSTENADGQPVCSDTVKSVPDGTENQNTDAKKLRYNMRKMIREERYISAQAKTDDENARKHSLFRGYYAMARSVLVMLAVLQMYVMIHSASSAQWDSVLAQVFECIQSYEPYRYLRYALVLATVLRYWHYSCASYTYLYNGYLKNKLYGKEESNKEKKTRISGYMYGRDGFEKPEKEFSVCVEHREEK